MSGTGGTAGRTADKSARGKVRDWLTPGRTVVLVLTVLALIFIFENTRKVKIRLLVPQVTMPLWGALLITFAIGLLAGLYVGRTRRRRR
ncbi:lipopolysaccharide assembly protein LapA domain-containing protein [Streptomyces sp. NPDC020917]|uniref:lipopolysaccharide assembly protein LapA domain-containing protein n=1 Tax=Streptomyces sp. NPDC020917 TaxID=3365102 RepID=UPI0037B86D63